MDRACAFLACLWLNGRVHWTQQFLVIKRTNVQNGHRGDAILGGPDPCMVYWQHGNIDGAPSSYIILRLDLGHALLQPGMASPKAETCGHGSGAVK